MKPPGNKRQPTLVSATQMGRHLAMTPQSVGNLVKTGVIALAEGGGFDQDQCRLDYIRHLRSKRSDRSQPADQFRKLKNQKLKMEIALLDGSLIDLEECMTLTEGLVGSFRAGLSGLPARITSDLSLRGKIETACNEMLTRMADDCEKKSKVLRAGQSLIEAEADVEPDDEEE